MQIVIDIPEDVLKRTVFYREFKDLDDCVTTIKALEKAVPLPKGHGRLIDADDLLLYTNVNECSYKPRINRFQIITAPTIIEADMRGEEDASNKSISSKAKG